MIKNIWIFLLLLKGQFLSKISYRKVVLDQQYLFYIFGLGVKLQTTYPNLVPRYTIRLQFDMQSGFNNDDVYNTVLDNRVQLIAYNL